MTETIDFTYVLPNGVTLHCEARIYPGAPPKSYAPGEMDPGTADQADIIETKIRTDGGEWIDFTPEGMWSRPYGAFKLVPFREQMEQAAIVKWYDEKEDA